jgi:hypothetical protein
MSKAWRFELPLAIFFLLQAELVSKCSISSEMTPETADEG